jgi:hypothetical protein
MSNCVGRGPSALLCPGVNNAVKTACVQYSFVLIRDHYEELEDTKGVIKIRKYYPPSFVTIIGRK